MMGTFGGIFTILMGLALIAAGIYIRTNPTSGWRMSEGWKTKGDAEPSDAYISSRRFTGAVLFWIASFFIVMGILSLL
ncbi:DUF6199 family natural product biosynthesis protein [Paenibacillus sp. FSL K6-1096]|uniref:DUF6199 family natural product biosynthesis protein n=1 Tax=Paenibacillus sp. FSL K6-1096 TaxID=2921460 RepID=UPI0030ED0A7E